MMKLKGTITVFLSFLLVFVTGLFFTMSEVVRYYCLQGQAERAAALACESTMADYCRPLWEQFGILAIDGGYGEAAFRKQVYDDRLSEYMEKNGRPEGVSLFAQYAAVSELADYHLLTDASCAGLVREAAEKFKEDVPESVINSVINLSERAENGNGSGINLDELKSSGKRALTTAEKNRSSGEEEIPDDLLTVQTAKGQPPDAQTQKKIDAAENPIENAGDTSAGMLLDTVLRGKTVSSAAINDDRPWKRALSEGTEDGTPATVKDKALFKLWVANTLQNYCYDYGRQGLKYETEYVIAGHSSDRENLQDVLGRIMALREASNFAAIISDPVKCGEAEALAAAIVAGLGAPWLFEAVKAAIIATWSTTESILDLRLLISGGRVSLKKSPAEWTTPIWQIVPYQFSDVQAIDCRIGMSYTDYLRTLLLPLTQNAAGLRVCDIMESAIRQEADYANFRADNCIYEVRTRETYQAKPMFLSYVLVLQDSVQEYTFEYPQELSYIT